MLGVQRTTVTQAARALQAAGLITYSRGGHRRHRSSALEETVCECYAVVRQKFDLLLGKTYSQSDVA